jgi:hypothetical protein
VRIPGNYHLGNHGQYLRELEDHGLIQHRDWTWSYHPRTGSGWDEDFNLLEGTDSYTEVKFSDPAMATYYQLRWS